MPTGIFLKKITYLLNTKNRKLFLPFPLFTLMVSCNYSLEVDYLQPCQLLEITVGIKGVQILTESRVNELVLILKVKKSIKKFIDNLFPRSLSAREGIDSSVFQPDSCQQHTIIIPTNSKQ